MNNVIRSPRKRRASRAVLDANRAPIALVGMLRVARRLHDFGDPRGEAITDALAVLVTRWTGGRS